MRTSKACCETLSSKIVQCSENGRRFRVLNPDERQITRCIVDGCLIKSKTKRCDYMILVGNERTILIELKGLDRKNAVSQLLETGIALGSKKQPHEVETFIVTSRTPKADTGYQKLLIRLAKDYRAANLKLPKQGNQVTEVAV